MAELKSKFRGKKLQELEARLAEYKGDDEMVSSEELAKTLKDIPSSQFSHATGFYWLDKTLENVEGGELVIVTGPTGHGKTSLLMTITKNFSKNDISSAWFEFELTPRQFFKKFNFEPPHFFVPKNITDNAIFWLEERILEAVVKYNVKAVFIDDLHHIFSLAKVNSNVSYEIGDIIAKLKDIAVANNLVLFLQVHIKDPQDGTLREPRMQDIRDSGLIKALADTVIGIWRVPNDTVSVKGQRDRLKEVEEGDIKAKVRIWKNRRAGTLSSFYLAMKDKFFIEKYDKDGNDTGYSRGESYL